MAARWVNHFAIENQKVLHILSVCLQPYLSSMYCSCTVLYYHLWLVWLYNVFPHYFEKTRFSNIYIENKMCVLIFCTILSETFIIVRRTERHMIINVHPYVFI